MSQDTNSTLTVVLMSKNYCYQFLPDVMYSSHGFIAGKIQASSKEKVKLY